MDDSQKLGNICGGEDRKKEGREGGEERKKNEIREVAKEKGTLFAHLYLLLIKEDWVCVIQDKIPFLT